LEQHWQEINIPNLLRNGVPIAYPWSPSLSIAPHFHRLTPCILQAYDEHRLSTGGEVYSTDFNDWTDEFAIIQQYDQFFQEISSGGRPDPDVQFNDEWEYYVVDFWGWSRRHISSSVAQEYYIFFTSTVEREIRSTVVLFCRWEPLDNFMDGLPQFVGPAKHNESCSSFIRGSCEIWEMHKHTPVSGDHFNLDGQSTLLPVSLGGSLNTTHLARDTTCEEVSPMPGGWL